uniref:Uncharacterized protein n=1 Tax=Pithovirus LCDPAC02 TaxID=2506601 RepID=A0A481YPD3_9VIRU|nr:MAG: hypothetical protein LCDPAC02_03200 [Pithovirus LCDPAC02]
MNYNKLYIDAINVLTRIMSSDFVKKHYVLKHTDIIHLVDRFDFDKIVDKIYLGSGRDFIIKDIVIYISLSQKIIGNKKWKFIMLRFTNDITGYRYGTCKFKDNEIVELLSKFERTFKLYGTLNIKDSKIMIETNADCDCSKFCKYEFECYCENDICNCLRYHDLYCNCLNCDCYKYNKESYKFDYQFSFSSNLSSLSANYLLNEFF